ncbi:MAG: T9SS type A sorting domain-containing protein, partial [Ferruginibacter sp.]
VVGNNIWFGTNAGRMYKSIDFGENWTVHIVDSLLGTYVHEIAFLDNGLVGVAHLRNSTRTFVLSTTDGGLTWTNYFQPANWKNSRVTAVPGTNAFVSTSVHNPTFRGSAVSYDAGQTWREIEKTASKAVCRFFDANTGYAGGFFVTGPPLRGGIFKSQIIFELNQSKHENISGSQSERQTLITADKEVQVYPTPAKNFINVALDEVLVSSKVLVSLLNTNGKLIEQRRSEGSKIVQFNVSSLPAGLYIIRINANGQTINKTTSIVR